MQYNFISMVYLLIILTANINCDSDKNHISIISLTMLNYTDTTENKGKIVINRIDYFLIKEYADNKKNQAFIDSFANKNKDADVRNYNFYKMMFYKESAKTNVKNLTDNPKDLYRYSQDHDLVYEYSWMKGNFLAKHKFKNGEIIDPKIDIIIENIPD